MTVVQRGVPRPKSGNDEQVALRLPKEWTERADRLRDRGVIAEPGVGVTRSDVLRAAISRGLDALEAEADAPKPKGRKR
jgi:predicted DNA-binding protein